MLARAGIAETLIPRVLQALQTLDLEWLNAAYADALNFVDPATADEVAVRDAFRNYDPVGQQGRMVSLFMGLYAAAGVGADKSKATQPRQPRQSRQPQARERGSVSKSGSRTGSHIKPTPAQNTGGIPEPLVGLLARLPSDRGWTQASRDKFLNTFGTVLDFCFPIVTQEALDAKVDEDE